MHSEEIMKLNKALKYCDQLKNNLQATILHVQMLNTKYNTKECDEPRNVFSEKTVTIRNKPLHRIQCQTPDKLNRSLQEIKQSNNTIIVKGIKVRRNVETVLNQLKVLRKAYQMDPANMFKRRLPLALLKPIDSPAKFCHRHCHLQSTPIVDRKKAIYGTPVNNKRFVDKKLARLQMTC